MGGFRGQNPQFNRPTQQRPIQPRPVQPRPVQRRPPQSFPQRPPQNSFQPQTFQQGNNFLDRPTEGRFFGPPRGPPNGPPQPNFNPAVNRGPPPRGPLSNFDNLSNRILGNDIQLGGPAQFVGINPAFRPRPGPQPRPPSPFQPRPQQPRPGSSDTPIFETSAPQLSPNSLFRLQQQQDQISARNNQRPNAPPSFGRQPPPSRPGPPPFSNPSFNRPPSQFNLSPGRRIN